MIITRKIELYAGKQEFWDWFHKIRYAVPRMMNAMMQELIAAEALVSAEAHKHGANKDAWQAARNAAFGPESLFNTSNQNVAYRASKAFEDDVPSVIRSAAASAVWQRFKQDANKVQKLEATYSFYKLSSPIPFTKSAITQINEEGFTAFKHDFKFVFGADKQGNKSIVKKIISGEYQMSDSALKYVRRTGRKPKLYLLLIVKLPDVEKQPQERTAQLDISPFCPVLFIFEGKSIPIGDSSILMRTRLKFDARRQQLQKSVTTAKGGHGRKRKNKAAWAFADAEKRFADTFTHQITAKVIERLQTQRIGKLSILPINVPENFDLNEIIRYGSYNNIVEKLRYKCAKCGIDLVDLR
jgi:transposase